MGWKAHDGFRTLAPQGAEAMAAAEYKRVPSNYAGPGLDKHRRGELRDSLLPKLISGEVRVAASAVPEVAE